eukprot:3704061-Rhodomonas_salina.2
MSAGSGKLNVDCEMVKGRGVSRGPGRWIVNVDENKMRRETATFATSCHTVATALRAETVSREQRQRDSLPEL